MIKVGIVGLIAGLLTSGVMADAKPNQTRYGLKTEKRYVSPAIFVTNSNGHVFADFGKDAFGWLEILPPTTFTGGVYAVAVGEKCTPNYEVNQWVGGTIRCFLKRPAFMKPCKVFRVPFNRDSRNTDFSHKPPPVKLPEEYGNVMPFRYVEFLEVPFDLKPENLRQVAINYPMDMKASEFKSSNADLDSVYEFCKYSILATSFAGLYVDGDRERIPYEADAYINQLCHYALDADWKLARATHEYLMDFPTWPTEWKQHSIMMAWADWMHTGNTDSIRKCYDRLKNEKLLTEKVREDGLIVSEAKRIGSGGDIIDWPPADRDGFEFRLVNAVVNAFRYRNLCEMSEMAAAIGKAEDAAEFHKTAERVKAAYAKAFRTEDGLYRDSDGGSHKSLHANAAALAFGLVPDGEKRKVADYLASRGMACSVYFSQYLLEALFIGGRADAAVALMATRNRRGWISMMEQGSTITMEAWDMDDKPNLDWNHAWGSPPLNIISRYVVGVKAIEPGWTKISVKPQLGMLTEIHAKVPTPKGAVNVDVKNGTLTVETPMPAEIEWNGKIVRK